MKQIRSIETIFDIKRSTDQKITRPNRKFKS